MRDASGYARRKSWVGKAKFNLHKFVAWDAEGEPLKEATYGDFRPGDRPDRWVAMRIQAKNLQTGHQTDLVFRDYTVGAQVAADAFKASSLEAGR